MGMKKTKVEAYDELVEGIDRGYFLYMSGVGPFGDGEAQVIGYEIDDNAHPGKEDLEEEGFADEDEWWRAYRGQEAVVVDRPMGQGGSNYRILDSLDVGKDFDIYYYGNGFEESPLSKDPVKWHKDRNAALSAMYERKIDLNNLFERVMNGAATLREEYHPRGLSYASQPSERELALQAQFDPKFFVEFNGKVLNVMPLDGGRLLVQNGWKGTIQNVEAQSVFDRIRSAAYGNLENDENFRVEVHKRGDPSVSGTIGYLRSLDDGTVMAKTRDGQSKVIGSIDEAVETYAPIWESYLTELFEKSKSQIRENDNYRYWKTLNVLRIIDFFEDVYGDCDIVNEKHIIANVGGKTINVFIKNQSKGTYRIVVGANGDGPVLEGEGFQQFMEDVESLED